MKLLQMPFMEKAVLISLAFFAPILPAMIAVGILIVIDTVMGVMGAYKQGDAVSSKKLGRVITKTLVYQLLIIASHLIQVYLFPLVPLVSITLGFLGLTEFLSIAENFQKVTGKNFIKYIREYLDVKFRGMVKEKDKE